MHVEQRLTTCEMCSRSLAVQYHWSGEGLPSRGRERIQSRFFTCPACRHENPMVVLMYAHTFEVKLVVGPEPQPRPVPNSLRRLWMAMPDRVERRLGFRAPPEAPPRLAAGPQVSGLVRLRRFVRGVLERRP